MYNAKKKNNKKNIFLQKSINIRPLQFFHRAVRCDVVWKKKSERGVIPRRMTGMVHNRVQKAVCHIKKVTHTQNLVPPPPSQGDNLWDEAPGDTVRVGIC